MPKGKPVTRSASTLRTAAVLVLAWLGAVGVFVAINARFAMDRAEEELNATGFVLHRVISQRVAQHDAHLTSLAALAMATFPPPEDALRQVAQSIMRFYPRIDAIDLLALSSSDAPQKVVATGTSSPQAALPAYVRSVFQQRPGEVQAYLDPAVPTRYFLGKRLGAQNPPLALLVAINPALLVEADERPPWAGLTLSLDGHILVDRPATDNAAAPTWLRTPRFQRAVDSQSQPLVLTLARPMALADIVFPKQTLAFAVLVLVLLTAGAYGWRMRREARLSRAAAAQAEQRTQMLEHETRLAHASRVNALGELASGIAHELTQPLTALLSQSQAAVRLAASGRDPELLNEALGANVREAKRAGDMLTRMRNYIRKQDALPVPTDLNQIARDVSDLMQPDLTSRGIQLSLALEPDLLPVIADPIEMEQVLHNLIRNAADSLDGATGGDKQITVETALQDWQVVVRVRDTGPGIAPETLARLFEPFFTTKPDGLGLGLPLCENIVTRAGGRLSAGNDGDSGACFTLTLPAPAAAQRAAQ